MSTTDPGGIRDSTFTRTDLTEICHRADSTDDLGELCRKSYNLPNPLIPALPSYESTGKKSEPLADDLSNLGGRTQAKRRPAFLRWIEQGYPNNNTSGCVSAKAVELSKRRSGSSRYHAVSTPSAPGRQQSGTSQTDSSNTAIASGSESYPEIDASVLLDDDFYEPPTRRGQRGPTEAPFGPRKRELKRFVDDGFKYKFESRGSASLPLADFGTSYVAGFEAKAYKLAKGGSFELGHYIPRSGLMDLFKTDPSQKEVFFYSLIQPEDSLGREMGLEHNKLATVLWKSDLAHGAQVLKVDKIKRQKIKRQPISWDFKLLEGILPHH
ncbi:uncharacterized protein UHOD_11402 [Ustilago sp. UG-2017b]|nr:uncharacterized protein UHOD_11402 [Ustilago sp. UG-2017b]